MGPIERFFSDRRRGLKGLVCAGLMVFLTLLFIPWARSDRPSFSKIIQNPSGWPGERVGPEYLQMETLAPGGLSLLYSYTTSLRFTFAPGPEGDALRETAARLRPGDWASVAAVHLEGLSFEIRRLHPDPFRKIKFAVSGAAVLAALALVALNYRWSGGALRPRQAAPGGEVPPAGAGES